VRLIEDKCEGEKLVDKVKLTVLIEDSVDMDKPDLLAKHGLSFFVEAETGNVKVSILMDVGPSPDVMLHNIDEMGIDLRKTDAILLSHGHYDHVGSLIETLKRIEKQVPVIAHPKIFNPKFKVKPSLKFIGASFKPSDVEASGGVFLYASNPVTIAEGITTSGEVERHAAFEKVEDFWMVDDGRFVEDALLDDQALIIHVKNKGLVVLVGCAHSGIINTIRHAQKVMGTDKVFAVLGGFHLAKADDKRTQATVNELAKLDLKFVGPCHCTGQKAVNRLLEAFGDRCHPLRTGDIVEL